MSFVPHYHYSSKSIFTHPIDQQFDDSSHTSDKFLTVNDLNFNMTDDESLNKFCLNFYEEIEQNSTEESEGVDSRKDSIDAILLSIKDFIRLERMEQIKAMKNEAMKAFRIQLNVLKMNKIIAMEKYRTHMCASNLQNVPSLERP